MLVQVQQQTEIGQLNEDGWSPLLPKVIKHITQYRASSLFYNSNHGLGLSLSTASGLALLTANSHFRVNAAITGPRYSADCRLCVAQVDAIV